MIVRAAEPSEYDAAGELTVGAYLADGLMSPAATYLAVLRAAAQRAAEADLLVAVASGRLVGTVTFALAGTPLAQVARTGEAEFRMLGVSPDARGTGVGTALVDACLARARARRCRAVVLSTHERMRTAHRIYARRGFDRLPERDWSPEAGVSLQVYRLEL